MIQCYRCGHQYTDLGSIELAKESARGWRELCEADGVSPRGLLPCPTITCPGEIIEVQHGKA